MTRTLDKSLEDLKNKFILSPEAVKLKLVRDKFEAWAHPEGYDLKRMTRNEEFYRSHKTQCAWEGWEAAQIVYAPLAQVP